MKRLFFIVCVLSINILCTAQTLNRLSSERISVSYDKTVHLIFPSEVKYVKSVDSLVAVNNPEEARKIVRIKANEKGFRKNTTISIATSDGKFYSYLTSYSPNPPTTIYIGKKAPEKEVIQCSTSSDIHIVAPNKITYIDFGNESISASLAEGTQNILRLKATTPFSEETNLSFALSDGSFYSYDVTYNEEPITAVYTLDNGSNTESVILEDKTISLSDQKTILKKALAKSRAFYSLGLQKYKQKISIRNILTHKEQTILDIEFLNGSEVPYDVDFFKFVIKNNKTNKRTASQDIDLVGEIISPFLGQVPPKQKERIIVVFPKFTLSDNQHLELNILEKGGGRNINYIISDESLNDANTL